MRSCLDLILSFFNIKPALKIIIFYVSATSLDLFLLNFATQIAARVKRQIN